MIVYGKNVWSQIKNDRDSIKMVYVQDGLKDKKIYNDLRKQHIEFQICSKSKIDALTNRASHQGIACKVDDIPTYDLNDIITKAKNPGLIVALDEIQDPHNVGAILRTCDCAGVDGVLMTKHNSAGLTPAAIKASTGAAYTMPVSIVNNLSQSLKQLKKEGYWVIGSDMDNARDYREGIYDVPVVLVIGSEGFGISQLVKKQCDYMVKLPMVGSITSLNASVACAVLLYQIYSSRNPL